ncbi:MAG: capsid cement protein [Eubacteriales bacterium]
MGFEYSNSFVQTSATVREAAGEVLEGACHKAVAYDSSGDVVLAQEGKSAFGLLLSSTGDKVSVGEEVDVLVKDVGLLEVAEAVDKGDFVTIEDGCGKVASSGDYVFGRAMTASYEAGDLIQVRIGAFGAVI